jgi:hypothetical protein
LDTVIDVGEKTNQQAPRHPPSSLGLKGHHDNNYHHQNSGQPDGQGMATIKPLDIVINVGKKTNQQAPRHPRWISKVIMTIIIIIKTVVNLMDEAWANIKPLDMVGLFSMSIVGGGMNYTQDEEVEEG